MPESTTSHEDPVDRAFRDATRQLTGEPVRPAVIDRRARRRRAVLGWAAMCVVVLLAGGIASLAILGKNAVDSTYDVPLLSSHVKLRVDFGEPMAERGHASLASYLARAHQPASRYSRAALKEEGFLFLIRPTLEGLRGRPVKFIWYLRRVGGSPASGHRAQRTSVGLVPHRDPERPTVPIWVRYPRVSGRYRLEVRLTDEHRRVIGQAHSASFVALSRAFFSTYRAPSYSAYLPTGWKIVQRYERTGRAPHWRFVTLARDKTGVSVLIDTTPRVQRQGDPEASATTVEAYYRKLPGYRRLVFRHEHLGDGVAFEWSYRVEGRKSTDILLFRHGDGFAVLAEGPARRFNETRVVAREIARSISVHRH